MPAAAAQLPPRAPRVPPLPPAVAPPPSRGESSGWRRRRGGRQVAGWWLPEVRSGGVRTHGRLSERFPAEAGAELASGSARSHGVWGARGRGRRRGQSARGSGQRGLHAPPPAPGGREVGGAGRAGELGPEGDGSGCCAPGARRLRVTPGRGLLRIYRRELPPSSET